MTRQEIYQLIKKAKNALEAPHPDCADSNTIVTANAQEQYFRCANRILGINPISGNILLPANADIVIESIRLSQSKSTLRKYARSIRHTCMLLLDARLKAADKAQRSAQWQEVERIVSIPSFNALIVLSEMLPADYAKNWEPTSQRRGKKPSLSHLPKDWREQMFAKSSGQYTVPMLICMLTGCRPAELEKGVNLNLDQGNLYASIHGAKVKENAGQSLRKFRLADHPLTNSLIKLLKLDEKNNQTVVQVEKGNSVTTHMRAIGKKIWPRRKETITCYTARHGMAADCKAAIANGVNSDLVSEVLGHIVDKTATYYGNRFQSGGISVLPSEVKVTKQIRKKSESRSSLRRSYGKIPSQKHKSSSKMRP